MATGCAGTGKGPELNTPNLPADVTLNPEMLEPPALLTKTQLVVVTLVEFAVIPPEKGPVPVDTAPGLRGDKVPVTGA